MHLQPCFSLCRPYDIIFGQSIKFLSATCFTMHFNFTTVNFLSTQICICCENLFVVNWSSFDYNAVFQILVCAVVPATRQSRTLYTPVSLLQNVNIIWAYFVGAVIIMTTRLVVVGVRIWAFSVLFALISSNRVYIAYCCGIMGLLLALGSHHVLWSHLYFLLIALCGYVVWWLVVIKY